MDAKAQQSLQNIAIAPDLIAFQIKNNINKKYMFAFLVSTEGETEERRPKKGVIPMNQRPEDELPNYYKYLFKFIEILKIIGSPLVHTFDLFAYLSLHGDCRLSGSYDGMKELEKIIEPKLKMKFYVN